eukprot:m.34513 g.34513  ORF g.34513 m.34513 type:complete len:393 (-) comp16987_c0_seq1:192-1370(-)
MTALSGSRTNHARGVGSNLSSNSKNLENSTTLAVLLGLVIVVLLILPDNDFLNSLYKQRHGTQELQPVIFSETKLPHIPQGGHWHWSHTAPPQWIPTRSTCNKSHPFSKTFFDTIQAPGRRFHILVLGDSIAAIMSVRLFSRILSWFPSSLLGSKSRQQLHFTSAGARCWDVNNSKTNGGFGKTAADEWEIPPPQYGPKVFGLENPQCKDCSGCNSRVADVGDHLKLSLLPMEFCRDMTSQSTERNTTQELIRDFILESMVDLVIFNCGVHDVSHHGTHNAYEANLRWATDMLTTGSNHLIFYTTTQVYEPLTWGLTTNARITRQNDIAKAVMREKHVEFVDFFQFGTKELYTQEGSANGVHMYAFGGVAYDALAQVLGCAINKVVTKQRKN